MPFIQNQLARATGFQNNCALNCLAHVLVHNLNNIPRPSLEMLRMALNTYYGINLGFEQFRNAIQINNPIHREVVLGPVLRQMLVDPHVVGVDVANANRTNKRLHVPGGFIDDVDMSVLANYFGIRVESYGRSPDGNFSSDADNLGLIAQGDNIRRVRPDGNIPVLKLWSEHHNHFEYEEVDANTANQHNAFYDGNHSDKQYIYSGPNATNIIKNMKEKISIAGAANGAINFSVILDDCEQERKHYSMGDEGNLFEGFSNLFGNGEFSAIGQKIFQAITGPFMDTDESNPDSKPKSGWEGILGLIINFAMKIFGMLQGIVSVVPEVTKAFNTISQTGVDSSGLGQRFSNVSNDFATASKNAGQSAPSSKRPMTAQFKKATDSAKPLNTVPASPAPEDSDAENLGEFFASAQRNRRPSS